MARFDRLAASTGLSKTVAGVKHLGAGLKGIESWLKAALKMVDVCDHKEWLVTTANGAIDALLAAQKMPAWLRKIVAAEAKKRVQQLVKKVCPAA